MQYNVSSLGGSFLPGFTTAGVGAAAAGTAGTSAALFSTALGFVTVVAGFCSTGAAVVEAGTSPCRFAFLMSSGSVLFSLPKNLVAFSRASFAASAPRSASIDSTLTVYARPSDCRYSITSCSVAAPSADAFAALRALLWEK